jgi:site-specific recombinase XerD
MAQNAPRFSRESASKADTSSHPRKVKRPAVANARANAQRTKLDLDLEREEREQTAPSKPTSPKKTVRSLSSSKRQSISIASAIETYIQDHVGGNHSPKTVEWHQTALNLFATFLEQEEGLTAVREIEAGHITAWFAFMRETPGARGKTRSERTIQTYARSVRAFFHWLIRRQLLEINPFALVTFPKVGKPLIQTITAEEFESLLWACAPPNETGPIAERAAIRNKAILWVFYDTGIRVSELCGLRLDNFDRKRGIVTVCGKGSKERRIALGQNCQRHLLYYLDHHRPTEKELSEWGSAGEDHIFLSETRLPFTKNGVTQLFARLKQRVGITGRRVSPHILRHTFAIRYLVNGGDPFSLQELLGHEDMATVKIYMRMNDETIQEQKRKFSPGDHLPTRMPSPRQTRRTSFNARTTSPKTRRA